MTNRYGMYTERGNQLVDGIVDTARREYWDWPKTRRHLKLLSRAHPGTASEAQDTVVCESVYLALEFTEPFYFENINRSQYVNS
jgi:hypothetical protein